MTMTYKEAQDILWAALKKCDSDEPIEALGVIATEHDALQSEIERLTRAEDVLTEDEERATLAALSTRVLVRDIVRFAALRDPCDAADDVELAAQIVRSRAARHLRKGGAS